jgi:hypothetical protein
MARARPWSIATPMAGAVLAVGLAACGSPTAKVTMTTNAPGSPTTTPASISTAPPTAPVDDNAASPCTQSVITAAAVAAEVGTTVSGFGCAGTFAYALVQVPQVTGVGASEHSATDLFRAIDNGWQKVASATFCPSRQVPAAIFKNACGTQ